MVGRVDDPMRLSITRLKGISGIDDGGRLRFAREDRDGAAESVEGIPNVIVDVPRHLLPGRENHAMDQDLVAGEHRCGFTKSVRHARCCATAAP